jgi:hypothetical protein
MARHGALMLIDAANVAQIMRDPRKPDATTRPRTSARIKACRGTGIACASFAQT